ncbi:hypothetical protein [Streptomyces erythrochromogenes]|uniref:hypothetical protein n=1 Tax=Streptomyces erythrochromogenes TaxID=285574 RepID=UPI0036A9AAD8
MPEATVIKQRQDMVDSHRTLKAEGFSEIVVSDSLCRLLPFLERLSAARQSDLGWTVTGSGTCTSWPACSARRSCRCGGGSPARTSPTATASRRSASASSTSPSPCAPTWTARATSGSTSWCTCPHDDECTGRAWAPVYSVTRLFRALNGDLDDEEVVCTVHGPGREKDDDHYGQEQPYPSAARV